MFQFSLSALVAGASEGAHATEAERYCDPVTNVCYCAGAWDSTDCQAMRPLCEPGAWQVCTDAVCSCTRRTWVYPDADAAPDLDAPLPPDRRDPS